MPFNESHPNFETFLTTISEHRAPVVFWIGAGVSADAKLPSWDKLRIIMAEAALEELVGMPAAEADELEAPLQVATTTKNLWEAFETLKEILGEATYKSIIRNNLGPSETVEIPDLHKRIWELDATRGIVSLNIDGLEGRAHQLSGRNENLDAFVGRDLRNRLHTFREKKPFIARLHGHHSDRTSWVFTKSELTSQVSSPSYSMGIQAIFSNFTVVFMGISADDVAAGGFLEAMTDAGLDAGNHFWITNRNDLATRKWAEEAGVLRVQYSTEALETHTSVIGSLFDRLKTHISIDSIAPPVAISGAASESIPDLKALRLMDEDDARLALNAYAKFLLDESSNRTDSSVYQHFLARYSPAIHQSSHIDTQQGYNKFFGYTAVAKIHSGPFSAVWRVQDGEYKQFALKIMQLDNIRKGPQLDSFRRGISSQKLIKDSQNFTGIATIEKAFEIPPSVIMEFVEGENLEEISQKPTFDFWEHGIDILINLCSEVERAHKSKFGILHRDIKPTNIMIPNYYYMENASDYDLDQFSVKLLNYDMTWHKDASGRAVAVNPASASYYAPELVDEPDGTRARDARVDSYGIGMTIFRVASGKIPPSGGSKSSEWETYLGNIRNNKKMWFNAAHNYVQRLVERSTQPLPEDRILVGDILARLRVLRTVIKFEIEGANVEIIAENLMHSVCDDSYEADKRGAVFRRDLDGYRRYQIEACQNPDIVKVLFSNSQTKGADWSKINKNWVQKLHTAQEVLISGNWKILPDSKYGERTITLAAEISLPDLKMDYEKSKDALIKAIKKVQID